jgi:hypothetical protein
VLEISFPLFGDRVFEYWEDDGDKNVSSDVDDMLLYTKKIVGDSIVIEGLCIVGTDTVAFLINERHELELMRILDGKKKASIQ